jgi:hypothetical protein
MAEFFPNADALRQRASVAAATRSEWRRQNAAMAAEFLEKAAAAGLSTAGIVARLAPVRNAHGHSALTSWEITQLAASTNSALTPPGGWCVTCLGSQVFLVGPPPHWVQRMRDVGLSELETLGSVSHEELHSELTRLAEYAS